MARRHRQLGAGLATRLERDEQRVHVHETPQERQGREGLTAWLAESDTGAELWLDYLEAVEQAGCQQLALQTEFGRASMLSVADDLFS